MKRRRGFTLIELLVAGTVLALLAAIAMPAYHGQVLRSHRALARAVLVDLAAKLEVAALHGGRYPTDFDFLFAGGDPVLVGRDRYALLASGASAAAGDRLGVYEIRLESLTAAGQDFRLSATAVHGQTADRHCRVLSLDSAGRRLPLAAAGRDCWSR
jgi:type IV pilus assembly protein PilE